MHGRILVVGPRGALAQVFENSGDTEIRFAETEIDLIGKSIRPNKFDLVVVSSWFNRALINNDVMEVITSSFHCPIIGTSVKKTVCQHLKKLGCYEAFLRSEIADQAYDIADLWRRLLKGSKEEPEDFCRIVSEKASQLRISFIEALDVIDKEIDQHHSKVVLTMNRGD